MTKNTSYHYSIIIPHKNTPRLLERCLYSIPTWDEIQIIIIDDNSNSESVDFSHFPGNGRKNTEVLFTKEGKGAGYARNIGLSHARGKWIIFADADDFFTADCFTIFNDVNPENKLRYQSQVPWGKMIRRSFLSTFHIQFDETRIANDVYFSCLVGIYAPKATTDRRIIYYCTESGQSLAMSKQDRESLIIRFNASMKCNRLLRQEKIHYYLSPLPWCIPSAKIKEWLPAKYFFEYLFFFRLQAFKELYYAFSAILSHMNEPATKETDNQCNKKTTNLRE